jgi:hypothetical protein
MKPTYRPKIRNGHISRRPVKGTFAARAGWMPKNRRPQAVWVLVTIGAVIAAGFVAGLHWQLSAHAISRAEVKLKNELSQAENEQRFLEAQQYGALTPQEIERTASKHKGNVAPVELDQPDALRIPYQLAAQQARDRERERREKLREATRLQNAEQRPVTPTLTSMPAQ